MPSFIHSLLSPSRLVRHQQLNIVCICKHTATRILIWRDKAVPIPSSVSSQQSGQTTVHTCRITARGKAALNPFGQPGARICGSRGTTFKTPGLRLDSTGTDMTVRSPRRWHLPCLPPSGGLPYPRRQVLAAPRSSFECLRLLSPSLPACGEDWCSQLKDGLFSSVERWTSG